MGSAAENACFTTEFFDLFEVRLSQRKISILHAVRRLAQDESEQARILIVIELAHEPRRFHSMLHIFVDPLAAFRDPIYQALHRVAIVLDHVFMDREHTRNEIRPDIFREPKHAAVPIELGLTHERLAA